VEFELSFSLLTTLLPFHDGPADAAVSFSVMWKILWTFYLKYFSKYCLQNVFEIVF